MAIRRRVVISVSPELKKVMEQMKADRMKKTGLKTSMNDVSEMIAKDLQMKILGFDTGDIEISFDRRKKKRWQ